jgi:hypothetical protein
MNNSCGQTSMHVLVSRAQRNFWQFRVIRKIQQGNLHFLERFAKSAIFVCHMPEKFEGMAN